MGPDPHLPASNFVFSAIGYGLIVSLGMHLIVNPFAKPEPEEHLNRIFGKR